MLPLIPPSTTVQKYEIDGSNHSRLIHFPHTPDIQFPVITQNNGLRLPAHIEQLLLRKHRHKQWHDGPIRRRYCRSDQLHRKLNYVDKIKINNLTIRVQNTIAGNNSKSISKSSDRCMGDYQHKTRNILLKYTKLRKRITKESLNTYKKHHISAWLKSSESDKGKMTPSSQLKLKPFRSRSSLTKLPTIHDSTPLDTPPKPTTAWGSASNHEEKDEDLEILKPLKPRLRRRTSVWDIYGAACAQVESTPVESFSRQIGQPKIVLSNLKLGPSDIRGIAITLTRIPYITHLDLSWNYLGARGTGYIAEYVANDIFLEKLLLRGTFPTEEGCRYMTDALLSNTTLLSFDFGENKISERSCVFIEELIKKTTTLKELILDHNEFDEDGGKVIGAALAGNKTLIHLDLTWNHLRRTGAQAICKALERNSTLEKLNLSWNGLGKEGCKALAESLPKNDTLRELDISANRINLKSLGFFLEGMLRNESLITIKMGKNPITTDGAIALAQGLTISDMCSVYDVDIAEVPVDCKFMEALEKLQEKKIVNFIHGQYYRQEETVIRAADNTMNIERFDPVLILFEYMKLDNLRIMDMFKSFDTDHTGKLTVKNFQDGFMHGNIPLSDHTVHELVKKLDSNKDMRVELQDVMLASRKVSRIIAERNRLARARGKVEDDNIGLLRELIRKFLDQRMAKLTEKKDAATSKQKTLFQTSVHKVLNVTKFLSHQKKRADANKAERLTKLSSAEPVNGMLPKLTPTKSATHRGGSGLLSASGAKSASRAFNKESRRS